MRCKCIKEEEEVTYEVLRVCISSEGSPFLNFLIVKIVICCLVTEIWICGIFVDSVVIKQI